jgi:hypothetical protein
LAPPGNELYEGSDELPTGPESAVEHPDTETEATQEVESIPLEPEEAEVLSESVSLSEPESTDVSSRQNTVVVIESLSMHAVDGKHLRTDHGAELVMRYRSMVRIDHVAWGITITTEDGQIQICTFIYGYSGKSYSVLPGVHAFKIRLDRLPLHAGRYGLKGGIGEVDSGAAIAEKGWEDALVYFTVRSDPSPENSVHANMNNLVVINGIPVAE